MRHFAVLAALVAACGGEVLPRVCESGRTQACACVGGGQGAQVCALSGLSWGACVCGDGGAADAGADAGQDAIGPETAADAAAEASPCAAGFTLCGEGMCVDLRASAANCGACGYRCPNGGTCAAGECRSASGLTCPMGQADCDSNNMTGCETQLRGDHRNCGRCGNDCTASGMFCREGVCAP